MPLVTANQKTTIISAHPCFTALTQTEVAELAQLFLDKNVPAGQDIVRQNELINTIYFIAAGKVEVKQVNETNDQEQVEILSTLSEGEAIGLSTLGFYSTTGRRTATVSAITDSVLLEIKLKDLEEFLKTHPHVNESMQQSAEVMLRMQLIKKAAPFAKISMDNLHWLAQQVTETKLVKETVLFQKGDAGDCCYLIQSGQIEIYMPNHDEQEVSIAKLGSPSVFGETALLLNLPRTASARALEDSHLLVLSRDALEKITKSEARAAASLENLVRLRSRPMRMPHVEIHRQQTSDGEEVITLKNSVLNDYYRLQEEGLFIWNMLDGKHTFRDITLAFNREYGIFDSAMVSEFIMDLEENKFIESLTNEDIEQKRKAYSWANIFTHIKNVMEASVCFGGVDAWMTKTFDGGIHYLFNKFTFLLSTALILGGFILFITNFNHHIELFRHTPNSGWLLVITLIAINFTIVVHELAHGYTTKFFGKKVANFGVGWFWIGPIAFCDTSDMWLASKQQRVAVDCAGIFVDMLLGSLAAIAVLLVTNPFLIIFLWLFAFYKYLFAFVNLNPILEFDGYYLLMDISGKDNLRESSLVWLIGLFRSQKAELIRQNSRWYALYWIICIFYICLNIVVNYYVINTLLAGVLSARQPLLAYSLTFFAVLVSLLSIWGKIKNN